MLFLRIKQAEVALADGRLDEAFEIAKAADLKRQRSGQDLIGRLTRSLLKRGREDAAAAAERLRRGLADDLDVAGAVTIVNDGALDEAADAFVRLLATLRHSPAVRRRA